MRTSKSANVPGMKITGYVGWVLTRGTSRDLQAAQDVATQVAFSQAGQHHADALIYRSYLRLRTAKGFVVFCSGHTVKLAPAPFNSPPSAG